MCLICKRIDDIVNNQNQYFVAELETGYVVIGDHQHFKGYTLFLCKQHYSELSDLDHSFKIKFLEEMAVVAEAVQNAYNSDKINVELLGNGDSHLHWHIFPRKNGDLESYGNNGRGPVWWYPKELMFDDINRPNTFELNELKSKLHSELELTLPKYNIFNTNKKQG